MIQFENLMEENQLIDSKSQDKLIMDFVTNFVSKF